MFQESLLKGPFWSAFPGSRIPCRCLPSYDMMFGAPGKEEFLFWATPWLLAQALASSFAYQPRLNERSRSGEEGIPCD